VVGAEVAGSTAGVSVVAVGVEAASDVTSDDSFTTSVSGSKRFYTLLRMIVMN